jgi:hypothetical protein
MFPAGFVAGTLVYLVVRRLEATWQSGSGENSFFLLSTNPRFW